MAEPLITRADARAAIARASRQEWFLRYGGASKQLTDGEAGSTHTTSLVNDTDLGQDSDFWMGQWYYTPTDSEERIVTASSSGGNLSLEWPLSSVPTSDDTYELWGLFAPSDVNNKMNQSIRQAWRFFPNIVAAESLIMQTGIIKYGLLGSDMSQPDNANPSVAEVLQIHIEVNRDVRRGQVTSTGAAGLTFTDANFGYDSDFLVDSDWLISIYDGPGSGQLRQLNTVDSDLLFTVDTDYGSTDTLTSDSKYAAWNPTTDDQAEWFELTAARFDQLENPDYFELRTLYPGADGMRIRVTYVEQTTDILTDSDEMRVPEQWLTNKVLSLLYASLVGDNRHDRSANASVAGYYADLANEFAQQEGRRSPAATMWQESEWGGGYYSGYSDRLNPLDWAGR